MQFYEGVDLLMELHFFYLYRHYTLQTVLEEKMACEKNLF